MSLQYALFTLDSRCHWAYNDKRLVPNTCMHPDTQRPSNRDTPQVTQNKHLHSLQRRGISQNTTKHPLNPKSKRLAMDTQRNPTQRQDHADHGVYAQTISHHRRASRKGGPGDKSGMHIPRLITLLSTHHSPTTVNRKARVFTMGTVKLNSAINPRVSFAPLVITQ